MGAYSRSSSSCSQRTFLCELIPLVYIETRLDLAALLGDFGLDAVDLIADIHPVRYRPLVAVFHDKVLIEEAEGLLGRCCGQANDKGIEVFQHLPPEVVDGAVALVGDDEVEGLDGNLGVIGTSFGLIRSAQYRRADCSSSSGSNSGSPLSME